MYCGLWDRRGGVSAASGVGGAWDGSRRRRSRGMEPAAKRERSLRAGGRTEGVGFGRCGRRMSGRKWWGCGELYCTGRVLRRRARVRAVSCGGVDAATVGVLVAEQVVRACAVRRMVGGVVRGCGRFKWEVTASLWETSVEVHRRTVLRSLRRVWGRSAMGCVVEKVALWTRAKGGCMRG